MPASGTKQVQRNAPVFVPSQTRWEPCQDQLVPIQFGRGSSVPRSSAWVVAWRATSDGRPSQSSIVLSANVTSSSAGAPLQSDHWQRRQRVASELIERQRDEAPMKPGIRPRCEQASDEPARNPEPSQSECDVDPVCSPERLDERIRIDRRRRDLVVVTIISSISSVQSSRALATR